METGFTLKCNDCQCRGRIIQDGYNIVLRCGNCGQEEFVFKTGINIIYEERRGERLTKFTELKERMINATSNIEIISILMEAENSLDITINQALELQEMANSK